MICSYLLHGYDVIQILKMCIEERGKADFLCNLRIRIMSDPCNKYEHITTSYIKYFRINIPKTKKE